VAGAGGGTVRIRSATRADIPRVLELIRDLASYEREPDAVAGTEADLAEHLFGDCSATMLRRARWASVVCDDHPSLDRKRTFTVSAQPAAEPAIARDVVAITLPAQSAYLSVLRTATAGIAARLDFTIDEIEDLRIAVDEACAMLLTQAIAGADLTAEFLVQPEALQVSVSALTTDGEEPSRETFAWTVLTALAGEVSTSSSTDNRVSIILTKRRIGSS
jgi:serine/threonine-protein kinase RsbW